MSYHLGDAPDLVTLLRQQVADRPDNDALGFLADPDDIEQGVVRWTYADLDRHARHNAAWMQEHLPAGSRVLLLYPNQLEFVAAFVGCLYAGMIAVPAPLPGQHRHHRQRVATITANAEVAAVFTSTAQLPAVHEWAAASGVDAPVLAGDDPELADPAAWRPVPLDRSSVALLQYTSGSTGDPKGVVITHDNILHNLHSATTEVGGWGPDQRLCGWIPMYHDLAMQGLLLATILRGTYCLLMEPMTFVRRPLRWLRVIDVHDINVTFAPNFAYELCVSKVSDAEVATLNLTRWNLAGNASEPVNPTILTAFAKKFGPAGFRAESFAPIYGMAEATGYISGCADRPPRVERVDLGLLAEGRFVPGQDGPVREIVSCGPPTTACEVRIVDPATAQERPDGRLGEIWLRGRSIGRGYWRRDDGAFGAATAAGEEGFLRTGDLGFRHDGEIFVHGRLKDTLIVHGRNIYPQDVEQELRERHPELGRIGAVFSGLADPVAGDAEGVVVTYEVDRVARDRLPALAAAIRHTVGREFGVQVAAVVLLSPGSVQRTTSGKVRRSAMRTLYREGSLKALYHHPALEPETRA
ncbi:fatty acyl-AMP ligase [Actinoplanes sp. NPDC026619]|uniref:fatty acyl-AMP ligase n=1 Tax=Actinoplanes sp. NPDC026619 TaxID=3155798 RepID=UPI0033EBE54E